VIFLVGRWKHSGRGELVQVRYMHV
jgi:hypothetical protein